MWMATTNAEIAVQVSMDEQHSAFWEHTITDIRAAGDKLLFEAAYVWHQCSMLVSKVLLSFKDVTHCPSSLKTVIC